MKLAILSDIHGNLEAFKSVLDDMGKMGIEAVRDYVNEPGLKYQKDAWLDEAVRDRAGENLTASPDFEDTHWYRFQLAAKAHLVMVMDMLKKY